MADIWFTSDLHFFHDRDFIVKERGFEDVTEMNEALLQNYNKYVKPEDTVYILGDLFLLTDYCTGARMVKRLLGHKHLIRGNHDTDHKLQNLIRDDVFESIKYADVVEDGKKRYFLCHYPTMVSNGEEKIYFCLCGHTHTKNMYQFFPTQHCLNIGVDAQNLRPVNMDEVNYKINNGLRFREP